MDPLVQAAPVYELVDQDTIRTGYAESEHLGEIRVADPAQRLHLGPKLAEAVEGVVGELLDCDGDAVGELGFVDEPEPAVADDGVRGEVLGGAGELGHGDVVEGGVEGGNLAEG